MDLVLDTLPLMVQLKEDGYKIASYMQPTDILLSVRRGKILLVCLLFDACGPS